MSRTLIVFVITYTITRLFYGISGFEPIRAIPGLPGYLLDLGIWLLVCLFVFRALSVLGIGKARDRKNGGVQD
jgi:hypothetical protein